MKLEEILQGISYQLISAKNDFAKNVNITGLCFDSRTVKKGDLFFALPGEKSDGHHYIREALERGAVAAVAEKELPDLAYLPVIYVGKVRSTMAKAASNFYAHPQRALTLIGVTGTKGKTTTTFMIKTILEYAGIKTGIIGTIFIDDGKSVTRSPHTTPESTVIEKHLREMVNNGCKVAILEVSSQGEKCSRTTEIDFDIGVFTNLSPDHIGRGEHADMEEYADCKGKFMERCKAAVINSDDSYMEYMKKRCKGKKYFFGRGKDNYLQLIQCTPWKEKEKIGVEFVTVGMYNIKLVLPMIGEFSAYNAMAAMVVCSLLDINDDAVRAGLEYIKVPGRLMQISGRDHQHFIVDYAHNGIALASLLSQLKAYKYNRLIVLFGCGGNRDKRRRGEMGEAAARYSDFIIVTSDNPRDENPYSIISDIVEGIPKNSCEYKVIPNRRTAIIYAVEISRKDDIIVIAGKGHEDDQIIGNKRIHFDDSLVLAESLNRKR